jgi:hypothetical protein
MILFAMLLIPLYFAYWLFEQKKPLAPFLFNAFLGLFLAAVFCAYKYFFSPYYFLTPDSFVRNFIHIELEQILLPLAVLTAAFLFVYKKDKMAVRVQNIFPFYAGFFAVYLPFRILNESLPYSAFGLFAKPVMFLLMLLLANKCQEYLFISAHRALLTAKQAVCVWTCFVLCLILPAAIEALWILGMNAFFTIVCFLIYGGAAVLCLLKGPKFLERL